MKWTEKSGFRPEELTRRMIVTNQMHRRMLEKNLERIGIHRAQHRLLMTLACHSFVSQVELARHLEVTPATIAVSLKTMEREGWICRRAKREDNRANFVELTEKGKQIVEEGREFFDALDEQMYLGFSDADREALSGYLDRIYENMKQMEQQKQGMEETNGTV